MNLPSMRGAIRRNPAEPDHEIDTELEAALAARRAADAPKATAPAAPPSPPEKPERISATNPLRFYAKDIAAKVTAIKGEIETLAEDHAEASLESVLGTDAAGKAQDISAKLNDARARLATLEAAYQAALVKDRQTARRARAEIAKTQLRSAQHHFAARNKAAEGLRKSLEAAAGHWQELIKRSAKAEAVGGRGMAEVLEGHTWPTGSLCALHELKALVAREMFRVSATPNQLNQSPAALPGAATGDIHLNGRPEAIEPLDETLKRAAAHVIGVLAGEIAE